MSKNTSFNLSDHFERFIQNQVDAGRYDNASDVMRAGLRLLEDQNTKLSILRAALVEGEESGFVSGICIEDFLAKKHSENNLSS